MHMRKFISFS